MTFWLKIATLLAAVWALVGGAIHWSRSAQPTAEKVSRYLRNTNLPALALSDRARAIKHAEDLLNRISFEDRQQLQRERVTRDFFLGLTPAEQEAFLDSTLPAGFKQLMDSFNRMDPQKRKATIDHAVAEMKKHEGEERPPGLDDRFAQKMVDQGMRAFYSEANSDAKLDAAPLIEQMQRNLRPGQ